jgi:Rieske Fe-S protein
MSPAPLTRRSLVRGSIPAALAAVAGFAWTRLSRSGDSQQAGYGGGSGSGNRLARLADVPPHGGVVIKDADVVIVRDASQVHAFSATCTHQGCQVSSVVDGSISCPCHGSVFDATTGRPTQGPATQPLPPVDVTVQDGEIVRT